MDRKITCTKPTDDNNRSYVYYEDDDGTEIIAEMDYDIAEALVMVWNEAIAFDTEMSTMLSYKQGIILSHAQETEKLEGKYSALRKEVRNLRATVSRRDDKIKTLERQVVCLDALFKARGGEARKLQGQVRAKNLLIQRYMGIMEDAGIPYMREELECEEEPTNKPDHDDRYDDEHGDDIKEDEHHAHADPPGTWNQRDHYKEM